MSTPMKTSYRVLRAILKAATPNMRTIWEEPYDGQPCVFCPNHAGVWGPVDMCVHFDLRQTSRPWFNAAVPYLAVCILPPVLSTVPGVPVYHDMQVIKTFRKSIEYLKEGDNLIIFPQQPSGYKSHHMEINKGFLQIAPMAWRTLKLPLKFYPVYIDHAAHEIHVRRPVQFDPERKLSEQEAEILAVLEKGLLKE